MIAEASAANDERRPERDREHAKGDVHAAHPARRAAGTSGHDDPVHSRFPPQIEGARARETLRHDRPRSRAVRPAGGRGRPGPRRDPVPQREHHEAGRQPVRGRDRDRPARSEPRRGVLQPRERSRHGARRERRRRAHLGRADVRAQRQVRQRVLRPDHVVGRERQPVHGVARPEERRAPSRSRSAPTRAHTFTHAARCSCRTRRSVRAEDGGRDGPTRTARARREAGRRREGARAEPEGLVRRPADDRGRPGLGLGHLEQQRDHAGGGRERDRPGTGRQVPQAPRTSPRAGAAASATSRSGPRVRCTRCAPRTRRTRDPTTATIRTATDPDGLGPLGFTPAKAHRRRRTSQQFDSDPAAALAHGRRRDRARVGHRSRPARTSAASTCCGPTSSRTRAATRTSGSARRTTRASRGAPPSA